MLKRHVAALLLPVRLLTGRCADETHASRSRRVPWRSKRLVGTSLVHGLASAERKSFAKPRAPPPYYRLRQHPHQIDAQAVPTDSGTWRIAHVVQTHRSCRHTVGDFCESPNSRPGKSAPAGSLRTEKRTGVLALNPDATRSSESAAQRQSAKRNVRRQWRSSIASNAARKAM
jgi:hypothetical protein